jgi:hypothetical protein
VAVANNPALANQLNDAPLICRIRGITVIEVGGVIVVISIILFAVQRLVIKTIDNRIKEAGEKNP